jgi:hypothetical protein
MNLSVLSTCVTKQTKDMRYSEENPDGSSALVLRTMMRYALERESDLRHSRELTPGLLAKIDPLPCSSVVLSMSVKVAR